MAAQGIKKFVIASGGNAGLAVAYSGWKLGIETVVVVPESTKEQMRQRIREMGAKLEVHGKTWNEAHAYAVGLTETADSFYVHPFDHPLLWQGHASLVDELAAEISEPDAIVLAVGGGGLFCGVMEGLARNAWHQCKVICCETEGAASLARSLAAGEHLTLDSIDTIATSLGAKRIADQAWRYAQDPRVSAITCNDAQTLAACRLFLDEQRMLVEPACGAALWPVLSGHEALLGLKNIVVVVCGGSGIQSDSYRIGVTFS